MSRPLDLTDGESCSDSGSWQVNSSGQTGDGSDKGWEDWISRSTRQLSIQPSQQLVQSLLQLWLLLGEYLPHECVIHAGATVDQDVAEGDDARQVWNGSCELRDNLRQV